MELFLLVALMWGGVKALDKGFEVAAQRGRAVLAARPSAPAEPSKFGRRVGRNLGEGVHQSIETGRGFWAGVKAGWPEGQQAAYEWRDKRKAGLAERDRDAEIARLDALAQPLLDEAETADPATLSPRVRDELAKRRERKTTESNTETDVKPTPEETEVPDPISTAAAAAASHAPASGGVSHIPGAGSAAQQASQGGQSQNGGGEITSYPQLLAALDRIQTDATDDLEDANADKERAEADAKEVEGMVASLTHLKLDSGSIGAVHQLAEAANARKQAAEQRASAAEQRATQAREARQTIERNYSQLYEAAQSAPAVPEREFTAAG